MRLVASLLALALAPAGAPAAPPPIEAVTTLLADRDALDDVPFPVVVRAATGHRVLRADPRRHAAALTALGAALDAALLALNSPAHPVHRVPRVNEASRFIEDEIRLRVNALPGWSADIPPNAVGREQRVGYPDLRLVTPRGLVIYLEPKLHAAGSETGTLRSFYYEPRALTGKIHADALHFVVGVTHVGGAQRPFRFTGWTLADLSRLRLRVKAEFQADNAALYAPALTVARSAGQ